jgi:uncharacterized OsmC-like protein
MEITVELAGGMKVNAHFKNFTVYTDQSKKAGGDETAPEPFAYFLSSLATCAGFFVLRFCQSRNLSTEGIQVQMNNDWDNATGRVVNVTIEIQVPNTFPEKYLPALIRASNECTVKRTLMNPPNIETVVKVT